MNQFTKLNLNGVDHFVAALYDGSGNEIVNTYETKATVSSKEESILEQINTLNTSITDLTGRVETTEEYATDIEQNKEDIQTNTTAITELRTADETFQGALDSLTIKVGENTAGISNVNSTVGSISTSILTLNNDVSTLKAIVNDEASGINALNTQADQNTADIAVINTNITRIDTALSNTVPIETYEALLARVVALEEAVASYHPSEESTE